MFGFGYGAPALTRRSPLTRDTLAPLATATLAIAENAAAGTAIGVVDGGSPGAMLALVDDAGGRVTLAGRTLTAGSTPIDFEGGDRLRIVLRQSKAGHAPLDQAFWIAVVNVFERPALSALTLSGTGGLRSGTPASGAVTGATAGSTIVAAGLPAGFTIDGPGRRWAFNGAGAAATGNVTLTETLADSANSPRTTALTVTIAAGAAWSFPAVFTGGAMPVGLAQTQAGGGYASTYNQAAFEHTGTMLYVSAAGADGNDGLSAGAAKRTIQAAVDAAASGSRITVGPGRFAPATVASKNLSFYLDAATYVGDLLSNADVASWGVLSGGRQAVTLASGAVSGFVDLARTRRIDRQGRAIPQVSQVASTAAGIATLQAKTSTAIEQALYGTALGSADPQAGVFRSAPSQLGASDGRDLAGSFDGQLLAWRTTAAAPLTLTGTAQVFVKGGNLVGGGEVAAPLAGRLVVDGTRLLGAHDQSVSVLGVAVLHDAVIRGCAVPGADLIDYASTGYGTEVGVFADQCSATGADNASTAHGGTTLRINGTYLDASRCWSDITGCIVGGFGCTLGGAPSASAYSLNLDAGEGHYAGLTFIATGATDLRISNSNPASFVGRGYFYDKSYVGRSNGNLAVTDRSGTRDTGDAALVAFDPSSLATLFKDAAGTQPVTAPGDAVVRINSVGSAADYALFTGTGTLTYQVDGTLKLLRTGGTANTNRIGLVLDTSLEESCNLVLGLRSSDTSGLLLTTGGVNSIGDYRGSGALNGAGTGTPGKQARGPSYTVDGGTATYATGTALKAAAFNGAPHVISIRGADLSWLGWNRAPNLLLQFDGDFFGLEISRATTPAALRAREAAMAARTGAVLV